jgi:hypothetical protein
MSKPGWNFVAAEVAVAAEGQLIQERAHEAMPPRVSHVAA